MTWKQYTVEAQYKGREWKDQPKAYSVRAVSLKHALYKLSQKHPDAYSLEATKCRCDQTNNDLCDACYMLHFRG